MVAATTSLALPAAITPLKRINHGADLGHPIEKAGTLKGLISKHAPD
jgi:hypothetical protein